jgi:hypothetical protein
MRRNTIEGRLTRRQGEGFNARVFLAKLTPLYRLRERGRG